MSANFTPFLNEISWKDSTVDVDGNPLPPDETLTTTNLGIRADADASHSLGNYQWIVPVAAPATSITRAAFDAAVTATYGAPLPAGNYWLNGDQVDTEGEATVTSSWGTLETPFSIPLPIPGAPGPFVVS